MKKLLQAITVVSLALLNAAGAAAFTASDGDYHGFTLMQWTPPSFVASYSIYRSAPSESHVVNATLLRNLTASATSFADTTGAPGVLYRYWLGTRICIPLAQCQTVYVVDNGFHKHPGPQNVVISQGTEWDSVKISWDAVQGMKVRITAQEGSTRRTIHWNQPQDSGVRFDTDALVGHKYTYQIYFVIGDPPVYSGDPNYSTWSDIVTGEGWRRLLGPRDLSASKGTHEGKIRVSWSHVQGWRSFRIFRATEANGTYQAIAELPNMTPPFQYDDGSVTPGKDYYYMIQSVSAVVGDSPLEQYYRTGWAGYPAPTGLAASNGDFWDRVELSWDAVPGANAYIVDITSPSGTVQEFSSDPEHIHYSATPMLQYEYRVKATDFGGRVGPSSSGETGWKNFAAPQLVTATRGVYHDQAQVSWRSVVWASEYEVHRAQSQNGTKSLLGTTGETQFLDTTGNPGQEYFYWVRAKNQYGTGPFGGPFSGYRIGVPASVSATDGTYLDRVLLSWSRAPGASYYEIHRATTADGTKSLLATVSGSVTSFEDFSVTPGQTYHYWVRSTDFGNSSTGPFSAPDAGYAVNALIFFDDFTLGNRTGAPIWTSVLGKWKCTKTKRFYPYTASRSNNVAVVNDLSLSGFQAGILESIFIFPKRAVDRSSAAMVFAYQGKSQYRYVRAMKRGRKVILTIGQAGSFAGEDTGRKTTRILRDVNLKRWTRIRAEIHSTGLVQVFVNGAASPAASANFLAAVPGQAGYHAARARVLCDNFTAWDERALP